MIINHPRWLTAGRVTIMIDLHCIQNWSVQHAILPDLGNSTIPGAVYSIAQPVI
jgi:hypothetical protein